MKLLEYNTSNPLVDFYHTLHGKYQVVFLPLKSDFGQLNW